MNKRAQAEPQHQHRMKWIVAAWDYHAMVHQLMVGHIVVHNFFLLFLF
jgi:hypothetical protein